MKTTQVIAVSLLLITGASVGVLAQNETATNASQASETEEPEAVGNESGEETMTICHVPPGNPDARHTIEIGEPAWQAHESHGDHEGACEDDAEAEDDVEDEREEAEHEPDEASGADESDAEDADEDEENEADEAADEEQTDAEESDADETESDE